MNSTSKVSWVDQTDASHATLNSVISTITANTDTETAVSKTHLEIAASKEIQFPVFLINGTKGEPDMHLQTTKIADGGNIGLYMLQEIHQTDQPTVDCYFFASCAKENQCLGAGTTFTDYVHPNLTGNFII